MEVVRWRQIDGQVFLPLVCNEFAFGRMRKAYLCKWNNYIKNSLAHLFAAYMPKSFATAGLFGLNW